MWVATLVTPNIHQSQTTLVAPVEELLYRPRRGACSVRVLRFSDQDGAGVCSDVFPDDSLLEWDAPS